mgnify:CR=1 FL=1
MALLEETRAAVPAFPVALLPTFWRDWVLDTAQALYLQAQDLRQSGIVAGLDVVRAEVRLSSDRQRATAAFHAYVEADALRKLYLAPHENQFALLHQLVEGS